MTISCCGHHIPKCFSKILPHFFQFSIYNFKNSLLCYCNFCDARYEMHFHAAEVIHHLIWKILKCLTYSLWASEASSVYIQLKNQLKWLKICKKKIASNIVNKSAKNWRKIIKKKNQLKMAKKNCKNQLNFFFKSGKMSENKRIFLKVKISISNCHKPEKHSWFGSFKHMQIAFEKKKTRGNPLDLKRHLCYCCLIFKRLNCVTKKYTRFWEEEVFNFVS